jgi:secretion/DNA translocation related TadE-like protein
MRQPVDDGPRHGRCQSGIVTIWAIAWMFVCLTVGWIGMAVALAEADQHHVDAAADLTSLSAAARLQNGGDACRTAASVAQANGVALNACRVEGEDVIVTVRDRIDLPFGLHPWVSGQARAGPS